MNKVVFIIILFVTFIRAEITETHWVFLSDKGFLRESQIEKERLVEAENRLSKRCLRRRLKARTDETLVDFHDIGVYREYLDKIAGTGAKIRVVSRWLNAVSIEATPEIIETVSSFDFVSRTRPVARFRRTEPRGLFEPSDIDPYYGFSFNQNNMLNTIPVHKLGINGDGVLICMTDTGFKLDHLAMSSSDVLGAWDFVCDDSIVSFEPGDPDPSESHGLKTWSIIGGYASGELIGISHGSSFLLARTEHYSEEDPIEEDYWIAAAEWADSAGADIISASLGYSDWYTPDSMTGDIAPITVAADRMAGLGICVVAAVGNSGPADSSVTAPGDGDSVIAAGACSNTGSVLSFSSRGPTADGRIKPDLVALGSGVWGASASSPVSYSYGTGTSVSTPLIAGLAGLLLQARPALLPMEVLDALKASATNHNSPNNDIGWGVPDVYAALSYPVGGELLLPVFAGWNLVSLPLEGPTHIDSVFTERTGAVWLWEPDSDAYIDVDYIEHGKAYFVLYSFDTLLVARGDSLTNIDIPVSPGWQAIGGVRKTNMWGTVTMASSASLSGSFFIYDPITREYKSSSKLPPGRGAFVIVTGGGNIHLSD
ncbi:hypothetical protein DRQ36_08845 [bacterium]|nr:MAG: hypothetical protein DRQ36_08845 [bacterium]